MQERRSETPSVGPLLLTIPQVAVVLGVHRSKVYDLIRRDGLPYMKLGKGDMRISPTSLQRWIAEREETDQP